MDLGVIRPNQIYNNSTRFNASISDVIGYKDPVPGDTYPSAHRTHIMHDSFGQIDLSNPVYSIHVPDILYNTPVFKLKPISQAIAAVFVSTFSMVTAVWAIFNFVASYIMTSKSKHGQDYAVVLLNLYLPSFVVQQCFAHAQSVEVLEVHKQASAKLQVL